MITETIRLGVLGAGYWGAKLCHEYSLLSRSTEHFSFDWVADPSNERREALRAQLNDDHVKFCSDYREVLGDHSVNAVHIAIPNLLHYEVARAALESKKHVLLEKPMTMTSREALRLASLSEESGLTLQVGHIFRFNSALRKVREIVTKEQLGKLFYLNLAWATYMNPPEDRDIVFDLASHPVDILNYLLDEWPILVSAFGNSYVRMQTGREEVAFVNLEFPNRVLASAYVSWIQHGSKERTVLVVGEKGSLRCDALTQSVTIYTKDGAPNEIMVLPNNTIRDMQVHFIERIRRRGPQFNGPLIGAMTVQVLEAISHSIRNSSSAKLGPF